MKLEGALLHSQTPVDIPFVGPMPIAATMWLVVLYGTMRNVMNVMTIIEPPRILW